MRKILPVALVVFLAGCPALGPPLTPAQTPAQALFDAQIRLNGALGYAGTYLNQPPCIPEKTIVGCKDPEVADKIRDAATTAYDALRVAKATFILGGEPDVAKIRSLTTKLINTLYEDGKMR